MMAKGTYGWILLATEDLDGTFQRVQASGAEVVLEPMAQDYGVRDCAFRIPRVTSSASRSGAEQSARRLIGRLWDQSQSAVGTPEAHGIRGVAFSRRES